jgi:uncharacterized protein YktB (UPF0637 family)
MFLAAFVAFYFHVLNFAGKAGHVRAPRNGVSAFAVHTASYAWHSNHQGTYESACFYFFLLIDAVYAEKRIQLIKKVLS